MQGLNFIAIDFETANSSRASICEAGICVVRDGSVQETRSWLVRPQGNVYNYWNTKIHGLCRKDTDDAPIFPQVWNKISKYLRNLPLVAHNKSFDERCLKAVFAYYHMKYPDYPVALGIIRNVKDLTYDESVHAQVADVTAKSRIKCMDDLLRSGSVWEVK